jgi:hypothetical protein
MHNRPDGMDSRHMLMMNTWDAGINITDSRSTHVTEVRLFLVFLLVVVVEQKIRKPVKRMEQTAVGLLTSDCLMESCLSLMSVCLQQQQHDDDEREGR